MIAIIAILISLLIPAVSAVRERAQMTGTMNNERQLYLAQFQMSNDGAATSDATSAWPGDLPTLPPTMTDYLNVLCSKGYLTGADAIKLLNAPGASYTATVTTGGWCRHAEWRWRNTRPENLAGPRRESCDYDLLPLAPTTLTTPHSPGTPLHTVREGSSR